MDEVTRTAAQCRHYAMCKIDFLDTGLCASGPAKGYVAYYPQGRMDIYAALAQGVIPVTPGLVDIAETCTLCGKCVQACPTGALEAVCVEDAEMQKIRKAENLEVLQPELKTKPRVYYKNLYRYEKCFIAGSVALQDKDECAEGAKVILSKGNKTLQTVETDNYGDFRIDALDEKSGKYTLQIEYPGYKVQKVNVDLKTSMNIGPVFL